MMPPSAQLNLATFAMLLDSASDAVVVYDRAFRFLYLNTQAERLMGASREQFLGKVLWDEFPERAVPFKEPLTRAMTERVPLTFEAEYTPTHTWTEGRCLPVDASGSDGGCEQAEGGGERDASDLLTPGPAALAVFFRDVTDRHEAVRAREEAEAARERMAFLAEASAILSASLDYHTTLNAMARIVVPDLCDWCAIQMPRADSTIIESVAVAHVDPEKEAWGRELNRRYPTRADEPHGVAHVLRTGEAIFMPDVPEEALIASARDKEHRRSILELGFRSAVAVPLVARGTTLGVLLLVTTDESGRRLNETDFAFAQELAGRAAIAIDNARLLTREHNIAERLQAALQPELPGKVPGLELKAFYQPALAEATIGGDFYDVFSIEKGCFALVVADLSGKGLAAAAQVATVRHMLRALLYHHETTIADALTRLNAMLVEHNLLEGFATLFVGAYDVNQRTLTYASCGQEPGLILRNATGIVEEMGPTGTVLGGFVGATFEERVVPLASGDVIALFTDGLTEAGKSRKDLLGVPGVTSVFCESTNSASSAEDIIERLIAGVEERVTPGGIRDDVCLLIACVE
jgi:PAS domain S-box-containing protein